jgi:hypothetical protein
MRRNGDLGVRGGSGVREFVFYVKGEVAEAGFLGASVTSFVVEDDRVVVDAPEVCVVGVSDGAWSLVFPIDGHGDVGGEYGACNGVVVGRPVRSFSTIRLTWVVADGCGVQT